MNDTNAASRRRQVVAVAVPIGTVGLVWLTCVAWTDLDMGAAWYALGLATLPVVVVGTLSTERMAQRWALDRGARIGGAGLGVLHRQVLFARVGRTLAVFGSFALATMVTAYYNTHVDQSRAWWATWSDFQDEGGVWALCIAGYVAASVVVQATKPRMSIGSSAAVLDRRRLVDVLDPGVARLLVLYGVVAAITMLGWLVERLGSGSVSPSPWAVLPPIAGVCSVVLAVWVAHRPQRAIDDDELAVDELARTATANAVTGAAIAAFGLFPSEALEALRPEPAVWVWLPVSALTLLGFGIWIGAGTKFVFRTRRIDSLRAAA